MGALAPSTPSWIPEDDLLLKNAIEAGASLESLARGAVCFSRRFTFQELQNRWHSLLFDGDVSIEASARILEIEVAHSATNSHRSNKVCSFKGKESVSEKKRSYSLRKHYHAMRKRICGRPFHYGSDLHFPGATCNADRNDGSDHLNAEPSLDFFSNCDPKYQESDQCHISEAKFETGMDAFPEMQIHTGHVNSEAALYASLHGFEKDHIVLSSPENKHLNGIPDMDIIHGCNHSASPVLGGTEHEESFCQQYELKSEHDDGHFSENSRTFQSCPSFQQISPPETLPSNDHFEGKDLECKPLSTSNLVNNGLGNICAVDEVDLKRESKAFDCTSSASHQGYSAPMSDMPSWNAAVEHSAQAISVVEHFEDEDLGISTDSIHPPDDVGNINIPDRGLPSEPNLCDDFCFEEDDVSGKFIDISLGFTNDGVPFLLGSDEKEVLDKSCFEGLNDFLMSSPVHKQTNLSSISTLNKCHEDTSNKYQDPMHNQSESPAIDTVSTFHEFSDLESQAKNSFDLPPLPDSSFEVSCPYGPLQGPVICVLNTEDSEIPDNSDVFPLIKDVVCSISDFGPTSNHTMLFDASIKSFGKERKVNHINKMKKGQKASKNHLISSVIKVGLMQPCDKRRIDLPKSVPSSGVFSNECNGPKPVTGTTLSSLAEPFLHLTEDDASDEVVEHGNFKKTIGPSAERNEKADGFIEVEEMPRQICTTHAEHVYGEMGLQAASTSGQNESYSDSEDDLASYSDVEAMILDMDLCPDDQESIFYAREVSRYRHLETKRSIIRLEQGANAYMQRAIASNGAFAVFYGRCLKYYVKKSRVFIGRRSSSKDEYLDIDLQKEGRANKVSRRQAVIEMDEDGTFFIRNMGKFPIKINDKELPMGKCCKLCSGYFIEIRGLFFMFEVNSQCVKQYLSNNSMMDNQVWSANPGGVLSKVS